MKLFESKKLSKIVENEGAATPANTAGLGAFSLGNDPTNPADKTRGSGEKFDKLTEAFNVSSSLKRLESFEKYKMEEFNAYKNVFKNAKATLVEIGKIQLPIIVEKSEFDMSEDHVSAFISVSFGSSVPQAQKDVAISKIYDKVKAYVEKPLAKGEAITKHAVLSDYILPLKIK